MILTFGGIMIAPFHNICYIIIILYIRSVLSSMVSLPKTLLPARAKAGILFSNLTEYGNGGELIMVDITKDAVLQERGIHFGLVEVTYPEPEAWRPDAFYAAADEVICSLRDVGDGHLCSCVLSEGGVP